MSPLSPQPTENRPFHQQLVQLFVTSASSLRRLDFGSWLRMALVFTIVTGGLLVAFFGITVRVEAASNKRVTPATPAHVSAAPTSDPAQNYPKTKPAGAHYSVKSKATPLVSGSQPYNGLGDLSMYSYVSRTLDDHLSYKVNVANGNLVVEASQMHIKGTGIDLNLVNYYNSEQNNLLDNGYNWSDGYGREEAIDLSTKSTGITFYGPSGYQAYFPASGSDTWKDAAGLNATLSDNHDGTWMMVFHRTGEHLFFNANGDLFWDGDQNENTLVTTYSDRGDLTTITDTQNRGVNFTQNSDHQITSFTDSTNRTFTQGYSYSQSQILLTTMTDLNNKTTTYGYDTNNRLVSIKDPLNQTTQFTYDSNGRIATITDANNKVTKFTYNSGNTVVTDANTHTTTYVYNGNLEVTQTTDALGDYGKSSFDGTGYNVQTYGDTLGDTSTFGYDANNDITSSKDGAGGTTGYQYKSTGNSLYYPTQQTDPQSNVTTYAYDSNGNLSSATDSKTGRALKYTYNSNGTIATQKDANNNTTSYGYDSNGNLTSITPPSPQGKTTITYDTLSRMSTMTDGNNHKTTYSYDLLDRLLKLTYNDGTSVTYTYDADGNVSTEVDHTGTTSFTYDPDNRILTKTLPGGTIVTTTYDAVGNLATINDGTGTITYTYDAANRMITLTDVDGSKTTYNYDKANRKTSIVYPNGTGMVMVYDGAGNETSNQGGKVSVNGSTVTVTSAYDSFQYSYKNGSTQTDLIQKVTYLDEIGHVNMASRTYTYDSQNQLTDAKRFNGSGTQDGEWTYGFDANGNLTSQKVLSSGVTTTTNYSYNADNELTQAMISGGATTNYTYDADGNETGSTNGPATTYNTQNQAITVGSNTYSYSGTSQQDRVSINGDSEVYTGLGLSTIKTSGGTTEFVRCSCGLLNNERTSSGSKYYYLFDGEGSIVEMTDSSGNAVNSYGYDPLGNINGRQEQAGINNPWRFAGGFYDSATGLLKFGIRYYDPTIGRWTQRAPIGGSLQETLKANPYVYAANDAVNEVDPSGAECFSITLWTILIVTLIIAGIAALSGIGAAFAAAAADDAATAGALAAAAAWTSLANFLNALANLFTFGAATTGFIAGVEPNGVKGCFS